ncbi:hypothetical protein HYW82_00795 [Candidatus Peregrinibacteria bacterium]|nr:hypothetical protein [Candidatus Peregrinibacteria bacterium]
MWRNERTLYRRKCDGTGKEIISVYSADKPFPVYENEYWYSDKWDALDHGRDFDFSRPFFEQFSELMNVVPQLARSAVQNLNCDFTNQVGWCKNCYLIFEADFNENCYYSNNIYESRFTMDSLMVVNCELCHECVDCYDCYNLKFSQNCKNCSDSWFLKSCIGCHNCYGCINLRNKEYYFLNEKYSKDEYEKKIAALNLSTTEQLEKARLNFLEYCKKFPHKYMEGNQNEDCTGNYMSNNQRCYDCFDINNCQDCRYIFNSRYMKDCCDVTVFGSREGAELCYEVHETGAATRNIIGSDQIWSDCYDIFYSKLCLFNSHHLFGCAGLKKQSYCIFNKKYSPEKYEELKNKIVDHMKKTGEWGEFFPATICPYGYNETVANDWFPLTKKEAKDKGYKWKDADPREYKPQTYKIPVKIEEVSDAIVDEILACGECGKNYKVIMEELKLYRRHKLPIPQKCPDCRHKTRFNLRNKRNLCQRNCRKCNAEIITTFTPDRQEPVYCEKCYLQTVN